jgi:hypothetical protein
VRCVWPSASSLLVSVQMLAVIAEESVPLGEGPVRTTEAGFAIVAWRGTASDLMLTARA